MKEVIWVGIGGFIGSSCRYLIGLFTERYIGQNLPYGTLLVNLLGSLLIGILAGYFIKNPSNSLQLLLITGFCGGFTTFSTFSKEGLDMLRDSQYLNYGIYIGFSIIGGLMLCLLGYQIAQKIIS